MATALAQRLRRLEAIRHVAEQLLDRPQLGRDMFERGAAGADRRDQAAGMDGDAVRSPLRLCARSGRSRRLSHVRFAKRTVWSLAEAREALERLIGRRPIGRGSISILIAYMVDPSHARDRVRVELCGDARTGARGRRSRCISMQPFAPLYVRKRSGDRRRLPDRGRAEPAHNGTHEETVMQCRDVAKMLVIVEQGTEQPEPESAPEELRILEALLFAADEPLDEKALAGRLPAGRRRARGCCAQLQAGIRIARGQSRAGRRQMDVPHRRAISPGC